MKDYSDIKKELTEIGEILQKFPESIQPKVYDLLINKYFGKQITIENVDNQNLVNKSNKKAKERKQTTRKKKIESYTIVKDLDLRNSDKNISLKELYEEKKPSSNIKFNTVAVYYLKKIKKVEKVELNHIYTCYIEVKRKPSTKFKQSILDTSTRYGHLNTSDLNNIDIPHRGVSYVEFDLPESKPNDKDKK